MYQQHTIIGHLGRDAEMKTFTSGDTCISLSVAVSEKWKGKDGAKHERTTWYNVSYFSQSANLLEYLRKGTLVLVQGSNLTVSTYDKAVNGGIGVGVSLNLRADTIRLLGGNTERSQQATPAQSSGPANVPLDDMFPVTEPVSNGGNDLPF